MKSQQFFKRLNKRNRQWPIIIRRVQGHSMVPVLPPGTLVVGWRGKLTLHQGDVVIFNKDNKEMVKRVERLNGQELFVLGDHPETSTDSRQFGAIPLSTVLAKIIWPKTKKSLL